jgi:hypothetical protein
MGVSSTVRFPRVNAPPATSPMEHGLQWVLPRVADGRGEVVPELKRLRP